jgi:hypothetical protein
MWVYRACGIYERDTRGKSARTVRLLVILSDRLLAVAENPDDDRPYTNEYPMGVPMLNSDMHVWGFTQEGVDTVPWSQLDLGCLNGPILNTRVPSSTFVSLLAFLACPGKYTSNQPLLQHPGNQPI